jgi:hypothetical protein
MKDHEHIDQRSLELARAIVAIIDADSACKGLEKARLTCDRWLGEHPEPAILEWRNLLTHDWQMIRTILLDEGQEGRRLRQSSPFCGILSARERWTIYRHFHHEPKAV